jgi:hypothetical protein
LTAVIVASVLMLLLHGLLLFRERRYRRLEIVTVHD